MRTVKENRNGYDIACGPNEELVASKENFEERRRFEMLLANMSARFVSLPAGMKRP
jgi:hypothetical protein